MPSVTYVERLSQSKTIGFPSSDPAIFDAFTPADGERLLVIVAGQERLAQTDPNFANSWDISDSQGLTWTSIDWVGNGTSAAIGMRAWISSPAAATPTTITLDCSFYMFISNELKVLGLQGATDVVIGYVEDNDAATDGGYDVTLTASPTTDDLTIYARYIDADGDCTLDMASGWTELSSVVSLTGSPLGVAVRDSSTSTTVAVVDTRTNSETVRKAIDFAFVITAVTGGPVDLAGFSSAATGATGVIVVGRDVGGTAPVAAATSLADVTVERPIGGTSANTSGLTGDLDVSRPIAGIASGATGVALTAMSLIRAIAGIAGNTSYGTGNLDTDGTTVTYGGYLANLLDRGKEPVVVFLEEVTFDADGNTWTRASADGIETIATIQVAAASGTSSRRSEQDNEGYESEENWRIRFPRSFPYILGAQSKVRWRGLTFSIVGDARRYNGSPRTAHIEYTIRRA